MPVCLLLAGGASAIVRFVYGPAWEPAAPVLMSLGALAACRILFELLYDFSVVVGSTHGILRIQILTLIASVPALIVGSRVAAGPGIAAAQLCVALLVTLPLYLIHLSGLHIPRLSILRRLALPGLVSVVGCVVGWWLSERSGNVALGAGACGVISVVCAALLLVGQRARLRMLHSILEKGTPDPTPGGGGTVS